MIGGALGEARGDLMPGFVDAALKTPYKLRVPLAPAEGLVLESQVRRPTPVALPRVALALAPSRRVCFYSKARIYSRITQNLLTLTQGLRKGFPKRYAGVTQELRNYLSSVTQGLPKTTQGLRMG